MKRYNHTKPKRNRNVHVIDTESSFDEAYHQRFIAEMEEYRKQQSEFNVTTVAIATLVAGAMITLTLIGILKFFK